MQSRRKLLAGLGSATTVALAGCSQNAFSEPEPPSEDNVERDLNAFHPAETATCTGDEAGEINISQHPDFANQLSFDGVFLTPTPCYDIEIASEEYDEENGVYTLTIRSVKTGDNCENCTGATTYSGGLTFTGDLPLTFRVKHDSETDERSKEMDLV